MPQPVTASKPGAALKPAQLRPHVFDVQLLFPMVTSLKAAGVDIAIA